MSILLKTKVKNHILIGTKKVNMSETSRWTKSRRQQKKFHKRIMENSKILKEILSKPKEE